MNACYIYLSIYAIYEFVHMSHTYTYTYVTYLTYMTYTQNICYLYVYTYKLRKPASFLPKRWSGKETGFLSLVYTYRHKAVTYIQRWHIYTGENCCLSLPMSYMYMYMHLLPTCTFTYVTSIYVHMWKIQICVCMYVIHIWYV